MAATESSVQSKQVSAIGAEASGPTMGLVLSILLAGAGLFLAGKRATGVSWFAGLTLLRLLLVWCLASPWIPGIIPGLTVGLICLVLWLLMLVSSYRPVPHLKFRGWVLFAGVLLGIHLAVYEGAHLFFQAFRVPTGGMEPTLNGMTRLPDGRRSEGDHFFVEKYAYWFATPKRGDIVVFRTGGILPQMQPEQSYVKRIAGVPDDVLSVKNGRLLNHGLPISPSVLAQLDLVALPGMTHLRGEPDTFTVPKDCYFVIGDNTGNSFDSRFWGPIPSRAVVGRVSKVYWPWKRVGNVK